MHDKETHNCTFFANTQLYSNRWLLCTCSIPTAQQILLEFHITRRQDNLSFSVFFSVWKSLTISNSLSFKQSWHFQEVRSLAMSPFGDTLIARLGFLVSTLLCNDAIVNKIWKSNFPLTSLAKHTIYLPHSKNLHFYYSGSKDNTVRILDFQTGILKNVVLAHEGAVESVRFLTPTVVRQRRRRGRRKNESIHRTKTKQTRNQKDSRRRRRNSRRRNSRRRNRISRKE